MNLGFDGSDNEAYQEDDEDDSEQDDEFEITSQDSEERNKAFYGEEYTLLSQPDETHLMSMTMQQRQQKETLNRITLLKNDIDQIKYRVQQRVNEGQHLAGNKFDFNLLISKYEKMAQEVDETSQYEQEDVEDDFMSAMESDPSQAELMCVC